MGEPVHLFCAGGTVAVDSSLVKMALPRVHAGAFTVAAAGEPLLRLVSTAGLEGQRLDTQLGKATVRLDGDVLQVDLAREGPFPGELALRLAYYVATTRLGGLLLHSCALAKGVEAVLACGKSGDGKSTLARLGRGAGLTLLTDEVVQLFPDGRVGGTPFRSDADNVGAPRMAQVRYFLTLVKAGHEALGPLPAMEAASVAMGQCFDVEAFALPSAEVRRRLLGFLGAVQLRALSFRKHPDAGAFVADLLPG
jgi:hypothetical protein